MCTSGRQFLNEEKMDGVQLIKQAKMKCICDTKSLKDKT